MLHAMMILRRSQILKILTRVHFSVVYIYLFMYINQKQIKDFFFLGNG